MMSVNSLKKLIIHNVIKNTIEICKEDQNDLLITIKEVEELPSDARREPDVTYRFDLKWDAEIPKVCVDFHFLCILSLLNLFLTGFAIVDHVMLEIH